MGRFWFPCRGTSAAAERILAFLPRSTKPLAFCNGGSHDPEIRNRSHLSARALRAECAGFLRFSERPPRLLQGSGSGTLYCQRFFEGRSVSGSRRGKEKFGRFAAAGN